MIICYEDNISKSSNVALIQWITKGFVIKLYNLFIKYKIIINNFKFVAQQYS